MNSTFGISAAALCGFFALCAASAGSGASAGSASGATSGVAVARKADLKIEPGPEKYFTGRVQIAGQFQRKEPSRVTGAIVSFSPGARTAWHTHPAGQTLIVTERGAEGVARIKELTRGVGVDFALECVGTQESMQQAIQSTRPGGSVSYVGVPHGVELNGAELFFTHVHLHGGPAPVRRLLPELIDLVMNEKIRPGRVFDLVLPLSRVAEGYRSMHTPEAIKALLRP